MDFFEEKLASDGFKALGAAPPAWKITSMDDLRESTPEYQLSRQGKTVGLCTKNEMKALHGLLNKRNETRPSPSDYYPGLNETLGFMSEVLKRVEILRKKTL